VFTLKGNLSTQVLYSRGGTLKCDSRKQPLKFLLLEVIVLGRGQEMYTLGASVALNSIEPTLLYHITDTAVTCWGLVGSDKETMV
jgi:hypothetical protein